MARVSGQDADQHSLLRDLRDATRLARNAASELARQISLAGPWELGYRCVECGKRERETGACCNRCAVKILGHVTQAQIMRRWPDAKVSLDECMRAMRAMLIEDAGQPVMINDEDGVHAYPVGYPRESIGQTWHGEHPSV